MTLFNTQPYRDELVRRLDEIRRIVDVAHPAAPASPAYDIGRDARGIAILLLFASYEHLLTSLCRGLLETVVRLRVGNRRLKNGLRLFAVHNVLEAIGASSEAKVWKELGGKLMAAVSHSNVCTINVDIFPADGSFMKRSQVRVFCELFDLGDPGPILREVWARLDTIVTERNNIAHGKLTPAEVGRNYALQDIRDLIDAWQLRWIDFISHIETKASSRDFFRHAR